MWKRVKEASRHRATPAVVHLTDSIVHIGGDAAALYVLALSAEQRQSTVVNLLHLLNIATTVAQNKSHSRLVP